MIKDIYPDKSQYFRNQEIAIIVECNQELKTEINIYHIEKCILSRSIKLNKGLNAINIGTFAIGGYEVRILDFTTAFDVMDKSSESPRYGFVSDFSSFDIDEGIRQMNKLHLTLIQFYDWMYRHHELVPRERYFIDPMKRKVDADIIKNKISKVHEYNMKAIAYGAMYGAENEYYDNDKNDLMMYNNDEEIIFINIIGMMDISSNTKWRKHIINEFSKSITLMDFDGIHIDQYGFPKYAKSTTNEYIDLANEIPTFINDTINETKGLKDEVIIDFNYVNNWPIDTISDSNQEFSYIEVWDPNDTYNDFARIITEAKLYSNNRPVVIAAYIHAYQDDIEEIEKETSALLTMATIYSQGAYPLLFGEHNGILSDPYYVNYSKYSDKFFAIIKNYQDFIVKYKELLFNNKRDITYTYANGINGEFKVRNFDTSSNFKEKTIALKLYECKEFKTIHLINLYNQENSIWNVGKKHINELKDVIIDYLVYGDIECIYYASPDFENGKFIELDYSFIEHEQGKAITFTIPKLLVWTMIYIKMK